MRRKRLGRREGRQASRKNVENECVPVLPIAQFSLSRDPWIRWATSPAPSGLYGRLGNRPSGASCAVRAASLAPPGLFRRPC